MKKFIYLFISVIIFLNLLLNINLAKSAPLITITPTPQTTTPTPSPTSTVTANKTDISPVKPDNLPSGDLTTIIKKIVSFIHSFAQIAFLIVFLIGGIMYITSAGDEGKAKTANKLMLNAIIGIVVVFSAYAIATYFMNFFK